MPTIAILLLLALCIFLVAGCWFVDSRCPSREQEERQAKQDVEDMLKRANTETLNRRRVRAGKQI